MPKSVAVIIAATGALGAVSCSDSASHIGPSIIDNSVIIHMDSDFTVKGKSLRVEDMDSRSNTFLIGKVNIPGYGKLSSSFVTQLLSAPSMSIPDSIPVDSVSGMKLTLHFKRGALTGDSLAPNRLTVYPLTKQLPADIKSNFDPTGYYDTKPLASHSYTASALGMSDTLMKDSYGHLRLDLPLELAHQFFNQYRKDPSVFQWPSTFNQYFPGLFVDNTFGSGCVLNIAAIEMPMYYQYPVQKTAVIDSVTQKVWVSKTDSVTLFSSAPEVLASTNFHYEMDNNVAAYVNRGDVVSVAPCGYIPEITLPINDLIESYTEAKTNLTMINNLVLTIPAEKIANDYNLAPPTNLLMVRKCDYEKFFAENRMPDNDKKSFWATYNSSKGIYTFTSMRRFIIDILQAGGEANEDDMTFLLVPISITTEYSDLYKETYVTSCTPYVAKPTLVKFNLEDAKLLFTFSTQSDE